MHGTLTTITNFSEKYPEISGTWFNLNMGANAGVVIIASLILALCGIAVFIFVFIFSVGEAFSRNQEEGFTIAWGNRVKISDVDSWLCVLVGSALLAVSMVLIPVSEGSKAVRYLTSGSSTAQVYEQFLVDVGESDEVAENMAKYTHQVLGGSEGSTTRTYEALCEGNGDNGSSILCGGDSHDAVILEGDRVGGSDQYPYARVLEVEPRFVYNRDADEVVLTLTSTHKPDVSE